nr:MAG TPA: hypothetical protein [Caudoviricetes sp.]
MNFLRPLDSLASLLFRFDTAKVSYGREGAEYNTCFSRE